MLTKILSLDIMAVCSFRFKRILNLLRNVLLVVLTCFHSIVMSNPQVVDFSTKLSKNNIHKKKSEKPVVKIIQDAEKNKSIPTGLLRAIGEVESGLNPYAINHNGRSYFFKSSNEAMSFVRRLLQKGCTNFGVGCFQLHYKSHASKFSSIQVMLDPRANIDYAAKLLRQLYVNNGYTWETAVKRYHSRKERFNKIYYSKVVRKFGRSI